MTESLYDQSTVEHTAELEGKPTFARVSGIPGFDNWQVFVQYNAMDTQAQPRERFSAHATNNTLFSDEFCFPIEVDTDGSASIDVPSELAKELGEDAEQLREIVKDAVEAFATILFMHGELT